MHVIIVVCLSVIVECVPRLLPFQDRVRVRVRVSLCISEPFTLVFIRIVATHLF